MRSFRTFTTPLLYCSTWITRRSHPMFAATVAVTVGCYYRNGKHLCVNFAWYSMSKVRKCACFVYQHHTILYCSTRLTVFAHPRFFLGNGDFLDNWCDNGIISGTFWWLWCDKLAQDWAVCRIYTWSKILHSILLFLVSVSVLFLSPIPDCTKDRVCSW